MSEITLTADDIGRIDSLVRSNGAEVVTVREQDLNMSSPGLMSSPRRRAYIVTLGLPEPEGAWMSRPTIELLYLAAHGDQYPGVVTVLSAPNTPVEAGGES